MLKMNNMSNINNSAIMDKSAGNPATTHTRNRYKGGYMRWNNLKIIIFTLLIAGLRMPSLKEKNF